MVGQKKITPCCHRSDVVDFENTYWEKRSPKSGNVCNHNECQGDIMMILGIHGIAEEIETLENICSGDSEPIGLEKALKFCGMINSQTLLLNQYSFKKVQIKKNHTSLQCNHTRDDFVSNAILQQKKGVAGIRATIEKHISTIREPADLLPYQWGQLLAVALQFQPDLIIEIGRGKGSTTVLFTEAAHQLSAFDTKVFSICPSLEFERITAQKCGKEKNVLWLKPLNIFHVTLKEFILKESLPVAKRILIFWRESGFDSAEALLGSLLPSIHDREHMIIFHSSTDSRYQGMSKAAYSLWRPGEINTQLQLGTIISNQPQLIAIMDFAARNNLQIHSAEHDLRCGPLRQQSVRDEVIRVWGENLFSLQAHWHWFSLNEKNGPYVFPKRFNVINE